MSKSKLEALLEYYHLEQYYPELLTIGVSTLEEFSLLTPEKLKSIGLHAGTAEYDLVSKLIHKVSENNSVKTKEDNTDENQENNSVSQSNNDSSKKYCPTCGKLILKTRKYCQRCGTLLIKHCGKCRAKMFIDDIFCSRCGFENSEEKIKERKEKHKKLTKHVVVTVIVILISLSLLQLASMIFVQKAFSGYTGVYRLVIEGEKEPSAFARIYNPKYKNYEPGWLNVKKTTYYIVLFVTKEDYGFYLNGYAFNESKMPVASLDLYATQVLSYGVNDNRIDVNASLEPSAEISDSEAELLIEQANENHQKVVIKKRLSINYKPFWNVFDTSLSCRGLTFKTVRLTGMSDPQPYVIFF